MVEERKPAVALAHLVAQGKCTATRGVALQKLACKLAVLGNRRRVHPASFHQAIGEVLHADTGGVEAVPCIEKSEGARVQIHCPDEAITLAQDKTQDFLAVRNRGKDILGGGYVCHKEQHAALVSHHLDPAPAPVVTPLRGDAQLAFEHLVAMQAFMQKMLEIHFVVRVHLHDRLERAGKGACAIQIEKTGKSRACVENAHRIRHVHQGNAFVHVRKQRMDGHGQICRDCSRTRFELLEYCAVVAYEVAVAPALLCLEETCVRPGVEFFETDACLGYGYANTWGDAQLVAAVNGKLQAFANAFGPHLHHVSGHMSREQGKKFVAAEPAHDIGNTEAAGKQRRSLLYDPVSSLVSKGVVDLLEVVEINDEQGAGFVPGHGFQAVFDILRGSAPVQEPGQKVPGRSFAEYSQSLPVLLVLCGRFFNIHRIQKHGPEVFRQLPRLLGNVELTETIGASVPGNCGQVCHAIAGRPECEGRISEYGEQLLVHLAQPCKKPYSEKRTLPS